MFETHDFEGVAPSADSGDVVFSGYLIDLTTMDRLDDSSSLTVVEFKVEADADYSLEKRRHVFGPTETVKIKSVPQGMAVISGTVPDDANFSTSATPANLMVGENENAFSLVATVGSESFAIPLAVIHPDNRLEIVEVLPFSSSDWDVVSLTSLLLDSAGVAGKIKLRLMPDYVSFSKLSMIEGYAPATNIFGCCGDELYYPPGSLDHVGDAGGAENYHVNGTPVGEDNTLDFDRVVFLVNPYIEFPCGGGGFTWDIPWKWYAENSVNIHDWMVVPQVIVVSSNGTVSISKNGVVITRKIGECQSCRVSE